ncbi:MAG: DUF4082 domain-containing protein [Armatimonadetes bacterium]|nr:DUF4082 domain-containing protein [Armatimonadota bacterium]
MKKTLIFALVGLSAVAMADGAAITSISGGTRFVNYHAGDTPTDPGMVGFKFNVNANTNMTHLGIWADNDTSGLDEEHQVGLWRVSDGALLASAFISNADVLEGDFYFEALGSSVALTAGVDYIVAAAYWFGGLDGYISEGTYGTDSNVNLVNAVFPDAEALGFVMPGGNTVGNAGRVGPNFKTDAVPEPATMAVLGLGAAALLRRRKKS